MENLVKKFLIAFVAMAAIFLATVQGLPPCCVAGNICEPIICNHPGPCCISTDGIGGSTYPPMPSIVNQDSHG
ncbi:hypothetical protein A2U01_0017836, partial [Trifolium medium]|nr:hypothetical protein [Trifolium medium]